MHGGGASQVIAKAKQRILEAADPAAAELVRLAKEAEGEGTRLRAVEGVLDRAGLAPVTKVEGSLTVADEAREALARLFPLGERKRKRDTL